MDELLELLKDCPKDSISMVDLKGKCEACGELSTPYFNFSYKAEDGTPVLISICANDCTKIMGFDAYVEFVSVALRDKKLKEIEREPEPKSSDELSVEQPEFSKNLKEFEAGCFKLSNGKQDEMLASIAKQAQSGRRLTEKQIKAFNYRCGDYLVKKRGGEVLEDPVANRFKGEEVNTILIHARKRGFSDWRSEIVVSLSTFFNDKGYLTKKQMLLLKKILGEE